MSARSVAGIYAAVSLDTGELDTRLALDGINKVKLDPFLMLMHHGPQMYPPNNAGLPFGPHPHRGFETVTFIRAGVLAHQDSGGHVSEIGAGGVQWMTAGSGLIHSEVSPAAFMRDGGPLEILQLWVNLPGKLKMTEPRYIGIHRSTIPSLALDGGAANLNLVSGEFSGSTGPITSLTQTFLSWVDLKAGSRATLPAPQGRNVLFYVIAGVVETGGRVIPAGNMATFEPGGDPIEAMASEEATLLFGHADQLGEPVAARGPFVMNTDAELDQAYRDFHSGALDSAAASA
jgi:redox-sensitive bicupin YhaK (pirin superfamily)